MAKWALIAHLKKSNVSVRDIINGSKDVAEIGNTGSGSLGMHCHLQVQIKDTQPNVSEFYKWNSKTEDPSVIIKKYGEWTPNDITLGYKATSSPYSKSSPHAGIDFSGIIDKSYERINIHTPANGQVMVVDKGWNDSFGNYVMFKILGAKPKEKKNNSKKGGEEMETTNLTNLNTKASLEASVKSGNNTLTIKGDFKLKGSNKTNWKPALNFLLGGDGKKQYTSSTFEYEKREVIDSKENTIEYVIDTTKLPKGNYTVVVGVKFQGGGDKTEEWYWADVTTSKMNVHLGTNNNLQIRIN